MAAAECRNSLFLTARHPRLRASFPVAQMATIGRDQMNSVVVDDPSVSERHARIEPRNIGWIVRDLMSDKGTWLNESRVIEAVLRPGDMLRLGDLTFEVRHDPESTVSLTSQNPIWRAQLERLPLVARTDFQVLIDGPSGSGKDVVAREIHRLSVRSRGPFIALNCSSLSESLAESELFGHTRGSFTGADQSRQGAFEAARGGTLFLDEIADLPLSLQPKLLRALENREIRPVGSDRTVRTDVRVIAASHKNMREWVRRGFFREDLHFRLNVCPVRVPALSERIEDLESLIFCFAREYRVRMSYGAVECLRKHTWPGNIRELKNLIARLSAFAPGEHIKEEHIEIHLDQPVVDRTAEDSRTRGSTVKEIERELILRSLVENQGNQRRAAHSLGMPKSTLHDRVKDFGIDLSALRRR